MKVVYAAALLTGCNLVTIKPRVPIPVDPPVVASRRCLPDPIPDRVLIGFIEDPSPLRGRLGDSGFMAIVNSSALLKALEFIDRR